MIELTYFNPLEANKAYQLIQLHAGDAWEVVYEGEILASIVKRDGTWSSADDTKLYQQLILAFGALIDQQHFNRLPLEIEKHWSDKVQKAIAQADDKYMVICKPGINFDRFEKVFRTYIPSLVADDWQISFHVYDAEMSNDFEATVKYKLLV